MIIVNDASITSYKCEIFFDDTLLSCATCFIFTKKEKTYLITNWHNFSGRDSVTLEPMSRTVAIPNSVRVLLPLNENLGFSDWLSIKLKDEQDTQFWIEHPLKNNIDIAAIEITIPNHLKARPVNMLKKDKYLKLRVADDVFILGYPLGITVAEVLPIWKRASLASEPEINVDDLPKILVDTATRSGLSGSPVFARGNYVKGSFEVTGDEETDNTPWKIEYTYTFIGIYSGRIGSGEFQAQLGIVWKETAIEEMLNAGKIASFD
jgi:hypothetical protein